MINMYSYNAGDGLQNKSSTLNLKRKNNFLATTDQIDSSLITCLPSPDSQANFYYYYY